MRSAGLVDLWVFSSMTQAAKLGRVNCIEIGIGMHPVDSSTRLGRDSRLAAGACLDTGVTSDCMWPRY